MPSEGCRFPSCGARPSSRRTLKDQDSSGDMQARRPCVSRVCHTRRMDASSRHPWVYVPPQMTAMRDALHGKCVGLVGAWVATARNLS